MSTGAITFLVILVVLTAVLIALYLFGRKMQKRQEEQQIQLQAAAQQISMFVIDKKKLKMKESGLPAQVIEQTPRLMRGSKVPILKVKVGPQIMNLMCDAQIFDSVPMRKEVKAAAFMSPPSAACTASRKLPPKSSPGCGPGLKGFRKKPVPNR